jgi:hypothetical protein
MKYYLIGKNILLLKFGAFILESLKEYEKLWLTVATDAQDVTICYINIQESIT